MRNQNQNLGGSRARRWFGYLWHEWIGERWRPIAPAFTRPNPAEWRDNRITAAGLGHATVLINFFGIKILTYPVLFRGEHMDSTAAKAASRKQKNGNVKRHELR
jgi:hypothetical protein